MKRLAAAGVDWRGLAAFVLLTFLLTWPIEIIAIVQGVRFGHDPRAFWLLVAVLLVPAFCAWIVRASFAKEGFRSAGLRFGPWPYYALAWLAVPWIFAVVYAISVAAGVARFDPSLSAARAVLAQAAAPGHLPPDVSTYLALTLGTSLSVAILINMIFTFGEEFGWTGYLLPKLLPLGRWPAALIYGVVWGVWQAPLIVAGYYYPGYPTTGPLMMILFACAIALIQSALRIRADSVVLTTFFHAALNAQARGVVLFLVFGVQPLIGGITGAIGIVVLGAIGAWLLATTPQAAVDAVVASLPPEPVKTRTGRRPGRAAT